MNDWPPPDPPDEAFLARGKDVLLKGFGCLLAVALIAAVLTVMAGS